MSVEPGAPANPAPAPDLAGYQSPEALAQAYRASGAEAQRLKAENDQLRVLAANPRSDVTQRQSPVSELESMGVPTNPLLALVDERLNAAFAPIVQQIQGQGRARQHMLATYGPDYAKYEPDVFQYLGQDPALNDTYQRMNQADPVAASEWGYLRFAESRRKSHPQVAPASAQQVAEAQIPSARSGDSRNTGNQEQEAIEEARQRAFTTGDKRDINRFASMRLKQAISKRFYETGHPG